MAKATKKKSTRKVAKKRAVKRPAAKKRSAKRPAKPNAGVKFKRPGKTGWLKADAVKFLGGGKVLVRRKAAKKRRPKR